MAMRSLGQEREQQTCQEKSGKFEKNVLFKNYIIFYAYIVALFN